MASASSLLEDIDDKFCQCCICFRQYKDPCQLPCLHRYCSECLQEIIDITKDKLKCPLCQESVVIPENGVEGLKKDFFMKEIVEFVQVRSSLKDKQLHQCGDCSRQVKATAYCFKCSDFLCKDCHDYHMTRKSLQEHRPHLLTLTDIESRNITLEKLSSLKEAPRCQAHLHNVSYLCCKTCGNLPICVACTYGSHKEHEIEDVSCLAESERERLKQRVKSLNDCKDRVYELRETMRTVSGEIQAHAEGTIEELDHKFEARVEAYEAKQRQISDDVVREKDEIKKTYSRRKSALDEEMEEKLQQIRKEYEGKQIETDHELGDLISDKDARYANKTQELKTKQELLKNRLEVVKQVIDQEKDDKTEESKRVSEHIEGTISRFENLTSTSANILESNNNWTAVQNVEAICRAAETLEVDMKREFPDVGELSEFMRSKCLLRRIGGAQNVVMSEKAESVLEVGRFIPGDYKFIEGIASTREGDIVISGGAGGGPAYINVVNIEGERIKQHLVETSSPVYCYCTIVIANEVAIAFQDTIGIYDARRDTYRSKVFSQVINKSTGKLRCAANDDVSNNIIVGREDDQDLYVLSEQLELVDTLRLPGGMSKPVGIAVSDGNIIVCDLGLNKACVVSRKGQLVHTFTKPTGGKCDKPYSVCTDRNGYIYILWMKDIYFRHDSSCTVAQYHPEDHSLLSERFFKADASSMTTALIGNIEKMLIAHHKGGKINVYSLNEE